MQEDGGPGRGICRGIKLVEWSTERLTFRQN